ncbi:MAG: hypothetical protein GEU88_10520 [Solirubrobacterales bacterium]|nr:hypothetical protein [Solirubrobacterales bacterium]
MPCVSTTFDVRLARRVLLGEGREVEAALAFFERNDPATLEEAVGLLEAHGRITPQAFEHAAKAWDMYWNLRGAPCD